MRSILFFTILFSPFFLTAQGIINLPSIVQPDSDKVNILYSISDSKSGDLFRVNITASIDGQPKVVLRSVSGDVGENVRGGKNQYKIVWDALKDFDHIGKAQFFITAEKMPAVLAPSKVPSTKPGTLSTIQRQRPERSRKWLLAADFMSNSEGGMAVGLRAALYKKWGGYLNINDYRITGGAVYSFNHPASTEFSMYLGSGVIYYEDYYYSSYYNDFIYYDGLDLGIETGAILSFKWFTISLGLAVDAIELVTYPTFAVGVRF